MCESVFTFCNECYLSTLRLVQVMNYSYLTLMNKHQLDHSNGQLLVLQHGDDECKLNAIEACVIRIWPDAVMPSCVEIK